MALEFEDSMEVNGCTVIVAEGEGTGCVAGGQGHGGVWRTLRAVLGVSGLLGTCWVLRGRGDNQIRGCICV